MHVDGPFERVALSGAVEGVEQRLAAEYPARRLDKGRQQPELRRRQQERVPVPPDLDAVLVDGQVAVNQRAPSAGGRAAAIRSAQDRFDADHQLRG